LRLLGEYFVAPRRAGGDESLASFAQRRLGREVFQRLVQPLVGGIYTADAEKLSLAATLPRFLEMERKYGGLLRGRRHARQPTGGAADGQSSGARYSLFMTPREGLSSMVRACAERIDAGSIRLESRATALARRAGGGWTVTVSTAGRGAEPIDCDGVILALPAPAAVRLLEGVDAALAAELARIPYAGAAVVSMGFRRDQVSHPLSGFGFVVPAQERRSILAASFSSVKFPGRAPAEHVLIRSFVGGACQPELAELDDARLGELVRRELGELIGASGEPVVCDIARWPASMAQYHLGHIELVQRIEGLAAALPGLALAGNAYHGVGISQCISSGQAAAERVLSPRA
jgi:oxygen-dependent protoporphyrinogen oxidase